MEEFKDNPICIEPGITPLVVRLVMTLDAWMTSDRWSDYIDSRIMDLHATWKTMLLCKEDLTERMVRNMKLKVFELKKFFLENYPSIKDSTLVSR